VSGEGAAPAALPPPLTFGEFVEPEPCGCAAAGGGGGGGGGVLAGVAAFDEDGEEEDGDDVSEF